MTRVRAAVVAATVLLMSSTVGATGAQATNYRYWTYWSGTGQSWTFSAVGPSSAVPADGSVEGWRFAVSAGVSGQGAQPTVSPSAAFEQYCGDVPAAAGTKRVAVVIDYGSAADAPTGQTPPSSTGGCAQLPESHTGGQVLQQISDIRVEGGLICAINGFPQGECAPAVSKQPTASAPPRDEKAESSSAPAKEKAQGEQGKSNTSAPTASATEEPRPSSGRDKSNASAAAPDSVTASPSPSKSQKSSRAATSDTADGSSRDDRASDPVTSPQSGSPSDDSPANPTDAVQAGQVSRTSAPTPLAVVALIVVAGLAGWFILRYRRRSD